MKLLNLNRTEIFYAYRVCSCQIDAEASGSGRQEEDEDVGPLLEVGDHVATLVDLWAAVQPHEGVLAMRHVLLQQVNHPCHLRIDEDSMAFSFESGQESVEDEQFSGVKDESFLVWNKIVLFYYYFLVFVRLVLKFTLKFKPSTSNLTN